MKYIAIDIDGCITNGKGEIVSPSSLSSLHTLNTKGKFKAFLCTGRSAPYVEAIAQVTGIAEWAVCENGAYLYNPMTDELHYHPLVTKATLSSLNEFLMLMQKSEYKKLCSLELGKSVCISLNPKNISIEELFNVLSSVVDKDILYINHSTTAVDITPKGINKAAGLLLLSERHNIDLNEVLSIGDSSGDIPFMDISGIRACPKNASDSVKNISHYISEFPTTEGVIDIIKHYTLMK
ncbi:MAG: HAD family phosphatase [Thiotrichaceae bacterium]|nr:HAD family phosphatase [Thiotrichaceae bacterium]